MIYKQSIYTHLHRRKDEKLHLGYDYSERVLSNTMSSILFNSNQRMRSYLSHLNKIMYSIIESVKIIKAYASIGADPNEKRFN
jgi:hypothetical protein